ncbi:MAG: gene transfer agent family protein [Asticcacaulis sp.]
MPSEALPANPVRGEVSVLIGAQSVRLCVTLGALARLEGHFGVRGFPALAARLKAIDTADAYAVAGMLALDPLPETAHKGELMAAIVAAFAAMNADA